MNTQFQSWFSQGKAIEALCGQGDYFVAGITWRDEHDFILALGELLDWARKGHQEDAAMAFQSAIERLLSANQLKAALRLLRSYAILREETSDTMAFDQYQLATCIGRAVREAGELLSRDEDLRKLLLFVCQDYPLIKTEAGLK